MSGDSAPVSRWGTRNVIVASVAISWGVTIATLFAAQRLPGPWKFRFIQADTISIGGGTGQAAIVLSAERAMDGMAMLTLKGAQGDESITFSVAPNGRPNMSLSGAQGRTVLVMELAPDGQPRFRFMEAKTVKIGWSVTLDANGQPVIEPRSARSGE